MSIDALSNYTLGDWQGVAAREFAAAETRLFIDGECRDAAAGRRFKSKNSANREIIFDEGDMTQPFGSYKQSGHSRDNCVESMLSYTQNKSVGLRLSA